MQFNQYAAYTDLQFIEMLFVPMLSVVLSLIVLTKTKQKKGRGIYSSLDTLSDVDNLDNNRELKKFIDSNKSMLENLDYKIRESYINGK